jgi:hypothetical protein
MKSMRRPSTRPLTRKCPPRLGAMTTEREEAVLDCGATATAALGGDIICAA